MASCPPSRPRVLDGQLHHRPGDGDPRRALDLRRAARGVQRHPALRRHAPHTGIPRQVLTNRLALLVEQDVLRREAYREPGQRERHEYRLTEKGFALSPVLVAIAAWGDRYLADDPTARPSSSCTATAGRRSRCTCGAPSCTSSTIREPSSAGPGPASGPLPSPERDRVWRHPHAVRRLATCPVCRATPSSTSCVRSPQRSSPLASARSRRVRSWRRTPATSSPWPTARPRCSSRPGSTTPTRMPSCSARRPSRPTTR